MYSKAHYLKCAAVIVLCCAEFSAANAVNLSSMTKENQRYMVRMCKFVKMDPNYKLFIHNIGGYD